MQKLQSMTIYDHVRKEFLPPIWCKNEDEAARAFRGFIASRINDYDDYDGYYGDVSFVVEDNTFEIIGKNQKFTGKSAYLALKRLEEVSK